MALERTRSWRRQPRRHAGMALVAVLWMVAALSLLAASLIATTRSEVRSVQQLREAAEAAALGDAAIQLAARDLAHGEALAKRWHRRSYRLLERDVTVTVVPAAGLVNLNEAGPQLLADLFVYAGGMAPAQAQALADRVVAHRTGGKARAPAEGSAGHDARRAAERQSRFDVTEDLISVAGSELDLFDRIRDFITVKSPGGEVYPLASPPGLIAVLAEGDAQVATAFQQRRQAGDPAIDMTNLNHSSGNTPGDAVYRLDAEVPSLGGIRYRRTVWIDLSRQNEGLPFEQLEVHPVRGLGAGGTSG